MARRNAIQAADDRARDVAAAVADEIRRVNAAIARGAQISISSFQGPVRVERVSPDFWVNGRWAMCNDGDWAAVMAAAGEPRARIFARA